MNGKGQGPRKGYNQKAYDANIGSIQGFSWSTPQGKNPAPKLSKEAFEATYHKLSEKSKTNPGIPFDAP